MQIVGDQLGVLLEDVLRGRAIGEEAEHEAYPDARASDDRLAEADLRVDDDPVEEGLTWHSVIVREPGRRGHSQSCPRAGGAARPDPS